MILSVGPFSCLGWQIVSTFKCGCWRIERRTWMRKCKSVPRTGISCHCYLIRFLWYWFKIVCNNHNHFDHNNDWFSSFCNNFIFPPGAYVVLFLNHESSRSYSPQLLYSMFRCSCAWNALLVILINNYKKLIIVLYIPFKHNPRPIHFNPCASVGPPFTAL